ncbi:MAG: hypothetical protein IT331_17350 [Anaerolineae bacterium]|nr:hypothetical protein [Anaerolineae bacterium]
MAKTGFLACVNNLPPLIFRFQFNPELLSDKKSYKYEPETITKQWDFPETRKAKGLANLTAFYKDLKGIGPGLINTPQLKAKEGEQRTIGLDFQLDASQDLPTEVRNRFGDDLEPQFAVLRSFMYPAYALTDLPEVLVATGLSRPPTTPPECDLIYGGIRLTCVMTDLNIKMTAFSEEGKPIRAEVSVTLKEQSFSTSPIAEFVGRLIQSGKALTGVTPAEALVTAPLIGSLFD